ncbi:glutamate synthase central domain-containing protein, partial [Rhizobium leguminosarum]|uniref:glutamate synthase central domain-containing protein n=1 Tax=Rhizobium leguminosarum TaxID=384 RepID=UPI003F97C90E
IAIGQDRLTHLEPLGVRRPLMIENTRILMSPMATTGQEAIGSMGTDTPISAMSEKPKMLYTYFKQNFAQVTNPPIDTIREELV